MDDIVNYIIAISILVSPFFLTAFLLHKNKVIEDVTYIRVVHKMSFFFFLIIVTSTLLNFSNFKSIIITTVLYLIYDHLVDREFPKTKV